MVRQIVLKNPRELIPYENNARINDHVVPALVEAIKRFGFNQPVVIDKSNVLVCGHTRIKAALELRMREVPCVYVEGLTQEEIDAYRLADNKIAEQALWDYDKLKVELDKIGSDIKMSVFGFENGSAPNVSQFFEPSSGGQAEPSGEPQEPSGEPPQAEPGYRLHKCPHCGEVFED